MILLLLVVSILSACWSVLTAIAIAVWWLMLAAMGVCGIGMVGFTIVEVAAAKHKAKMVSLDDMRAALRSGSLDAEIERINLRNAKRRGAP